VREVGDAARRLITSLHTHAPSRARLRPEARATASDEAADFNARPGMEPINDILARRVFAFVILATLLPLGACNNAYGPPVNGAPETWGHEHYLDVQADQQRNQNRRHRR
jgi:hypothetical protein